MCRKITAVFPLFNIHRCPPPQDDYKKMDWICDGIDREGDSAWGHYSVLYDVPHPQFEIRYAFIKKNISAGL